MATHTFTITKSVEFTVEEDLPACSVTVVIDDAGDRRHLQVRLTHEGVIVDAFLNDEHFGSTCETYGEILERLGAG